MLVHQENISPLVSVHSQSKIINLNIPRFYSPKMATLRDFAKMGHLINFPFLKKIEREKKVQAEMTRDLSIHFVSLCPIRL